MATRSKPFIGSGVKFKFGVLDCCFGCKLLRKIGIIRIDFIFRMSLTGSDDLRKLMYMFFFDFDS